MFEFEIKARSKKTAARVGVFKTPHGEIKTPAFMAVATVGAVKGLLPGEVTDLGGEIILANAYHLYLRPGAENIARLGGLHSLIGYTGPILTDSGGFQAFSLGRHRRGEAFSGPHLVRRPEIDQQGITFYSHLDGSKHRFTPEKVLDIEWQLRSDIAMVLDVCAPYKSSRGELKAALEKTHDWAKTSIYYHQKESRADKQAAFPIVQGGTEKDLREESAKVLAELDAPGNAIGGVSVGESKTEMAAQIAWSKSCLPPEKLCYVMGIGEPDDLAMAVNLGVDLFDCVLPTRLARHGIVYTIFNIAAGRFEKIDLKKLVYTTSRDLLSPDCDCIACSLGYTRAWLHQLLKENDPLSVRLLSAHNLRYYYRLIEALREETNKAAQS